MCGVLLTGCNGGSLIEYRLKPTSQTAMEFYNDIRDEMQNFQSVITNFDTTSFSGKTKIKYSDLMPALTSENDNLYMILPVLDYFVSGTDESAVPIGQYNLQDIGIEYKVYNASNLTDKYAYVKLPTTQNASIPAPSVSNDLSGAEDVIDEVIASWGNALRFKFKEALNEATGVTTYTIGAVAGYYYPSALDVPEQDTLSVANGYKIIRNDAEKQITIVYKEDSQLRTKIVSFNDSYDSGAKTVIKYNGDKTANESLQSAGSYEYVLSSTPMLGNYTIQYLANKGYFTFTHDKLGAAVNSNYVKIEVYALNGGMYILRLNKIEPAKNNLTFDYYIAADGQNGRLKYKESNVSIEFIADFEQVSHQTFAVLNAAERTKGLPAAVYEITNQVVTSESVGMQ